MENLEEKISLTEPEKLICSYLVDVCNTFDHQVVARMAGGWVRDKLIKKESCDYDVTIEGCHGADFASALCNYLQSKSIDFKVIQNPEQSKHLSSSKVCLFGDTWIDFCSLRSEKYSEDSRIPEVSDGTLLQDAERRDFTINALYYNVCTKKIEDLFNGYQDLQNKILRTPKDSLISFQEDPLRILRALRFASRFNLEYEDSIPNSIQKCQEIYLRKVASDRASFEVSQALSGPDPLRYIKDLINFGFFKLIFDRTNELEFDNETIVNRVAFITSHNHKDFQLQLILGAIYYEEFGKGFVASKKYGRKVDHVEKAISRILRMTNQVCDETRVLLNGAHNLQKIQKLDNVQIGKAIRDSGQFWEISASLLFDEEKFNFITNDVSKYAIEHKLDKAYEIKPLFNGNDLSKIFKVKGQVLRTYQDSLIEWQLQNPEGTKDDYLEFINLSK